MLKTRKLVLFLFSLLMMIGMMIPSIEAKAAGELAAGEIQVNYLDEAIEINTSADLGYVYVTNRYDVDKPTSAKWDRYALKANGSGYFASIDFQGYTRETSNSIVYVKGDTAVYPIQINAQDRSFTVAFNGFDSVIPKKMHDAITLDNTNSISATDCGYLYFTKLFRNVTDIITASTDVKLTDVQWKKGATGYWQPLSDLHLNWYTNQGASLYFRIAPSSTVGIGTKINDVYVNENGARASKVVKITYRKKDKAPSVKVDGTKYTISLKKGQEYKVGTNGEWINVFEVHGDPNKKGKVPVLTLYDLYKSYTDESVNVPYNYNPGTEDMIYVRTAPTTSKISSKIANVALDTPEDAATVAKLDTADPDLLTATYYKSYDKLSGVVVSNSTAYAYQVAVVDKTLVYSGSVLDQEKIIKLGNERYIYWNNVKAAYFAKDGSFVRAATGKISASKYEDIPEANRIIIYRLTTIKENTKTLENEFRVASPAKELGMPTTVNQAITFADEAGVVSTDATTKLVTVQMVGDTSTIIKELAVTLSNPTSTGATPKIVCISDPSNPKSVTAPSGVRLLSYGTINATSGKVRVSVSASGKESTSYWKVTAEGATTYVKLVVTVPNAGSISTAKIEKGTASGTVKISATAGTGNTLAYKIGSIEVTGLKVGEKVSGTTSFSTSKEFTATVDQYITIYELSSGKVVNYKSIKVTATDIAP